MLPIEMAISIVLKVLHHLLRSSLDPFGGLSSWALISTQYTEVLSLGPDDSAGVVVGERLLAFLDLGFGLAGLPSLRDQGSGVTDELMMKIWAFLDFNWHRVLRLEGEGGGLD